MSTMILYNASNGNIYGYYGTPYPTKDEAIKLRWPEVDINDDYFEDPEIGEIWLDDIWFEPISKEELEKDLYLILDSGFFWTLEEIRDECRGMSYEEFDEYLDTLIRQGIERTGGVIKMEDHT